MDKRYQIFISSTFSDLKDERARVMQTLMSLDCIPSGMELFPAMDEEQFEFIKSIIDDCDYYLLIIGARYGSMDKNGVSYTEKEYDYAVSKGIPVMAFLHNDISSLPMNKADLKPSLRKKLETFRKKVETGRLVNYWKDADDLNTKVAIAIPRTIKRFPRSGWIKADLMTNDELNQKRRIDIISHNEKKESSPNEDCLTIKKFECLIKKVEGKYPPKFYYDIGIIYYKEKNYIDAETRFEKAIAISPDFVEAYQALAEVNNVSSI